MMRLLASLGLLVLLAGCAPQWQRIGPPVDTPHFTTKAFHTADGADLPMRIWLPWDKPLEASIVALHGFNDYRRAFDAPGKGLARRGFAVYAFDQRGFGGSPQRGLWAGTDQMVADLAAAAKLAKAAHPDKPLYLLGESMGAAVMLAAITRHVEMPVDGVILAAPAIWGWQVQAPINRSLFDIAMATIPGARVQPRGVYREASSNHYMLRQMWRDPNIIKATRVDTAFGLVELMTEAFDAGARLGPSPRWLIMFGGREDILTGSSVAGFLNQLPKLPPEAGRVAFYGRAHHMMLRDLQARTIYDDIAAWIRDPAAKLPSGADFGP
ncbi:alpha/beta fold hydrolase [Dongia sp.]|uniref:alpha/beta fold hydrolase n=1 Tax=Dongia sp. TaxID=1977262 RepID=UPI0035B36BB0